MAQTIYNTFPYYVFPNLFIAQKWQNATIKAAAELKFGFSLIVWYFNCRKAIVVNVSANAYERSCSIYLFELQQTESYFFPNYV